jgi:hypothetical protein
MIETAGTRRRGRPGAKVVILLAVVLVVALASQAAALDERYHTMNEVRAELKAVAAAYPGITVLDTVAYSTQDAYPIWALKISDNAGDNEDEPVVLYNGVHHAEEVMGLEICMWMIDELTSGYGVVDSVTAWIDGAEIWFIPLLNPEGHELVLDGTSDIWRKNKRDNNENDEFDLDYDGVDLNNNYDWNWDEGGSANPENEYYRGPSACSENEAQLIRDFCIAEKPVFSLNYHTPRSSVGYYIYYPWYWVGYGFAPDHFVIFDVATQLANRTMTEDDVPFTILYGYANAGKCRNWQYGAVGTIGLTNEILSQESHPGGARLDGICERQATGAYYLLDRLQGPGLTGHVTDAVSGDPLVAEVKVHENWAEIIEPRTTNATYGRYWRMLVPGLYTVEFIAEGYLGMTFTEVEVDSTGLAVLDAPLWPETSGVIESDISIGKIVGVSPNPFRGSTTVTFAAPPARPAEVEIYSAAGRLISRLPANVSENGAGAVTWGGIDLEGDPVASGVYFARLVTESGSDRAKVVFLR